LKPINRFWNLLKLYKADLKQIYIYAILSGIVNLSLPIGIQAIINFIQMGEISTSWILLVIFVLIGIGATGMFQVLQLRRVENIQQDLFARSAIEFTYRLPKISAIDTEKQPMTDLSNRFFDTLTIQKGLPKILIDFSLSAFQIIFGLILLAVYSPYFILYGIALVFILLIIGRIIGPIGLKTSLEESKYKYKIAFWLDEVARLNLSFKTFRKNGIHLKKTDQLTSSYLTARLKHFKILLRQFHYFIAFKIIVAAGLLVIGGVLVFNQQMSIGQFVAAEIIIIIIINSVEKLLFAIDTIYDVLTALEKIGIVTDLPLDSEDGKAKPKADQGLQVEVRNLEYKFPDSFNTLFHGLNFLVKPGEKLLIKGKTGAGKSTLAQLIAGIYQVQDGQILINNIPVENWDRDEFYKYVSISLPNNQLFEGTLRENIFLGNVMSDEQIEEILKQVYLDEFVNSQSEGIDSLVTGVGKKISRSLVQKIKIARIVAASPKLVILEDPLHFIDSPQKELIIKNLTSNKDWTLIVISNEPRWEEFCNQTIKL